jgi:hypothetical protein
MYNNKGETKEILQKFKKRPTTLRIKHIYSVLKAMQYTEHLIFPLRVESCISVTAYFTLV